MNQSFLIKMLIFIILVIMGVISFLMIKLINPDFFGSSSEEKDNARTNPKEFSQKDIEDSMNKREDRIKALKEVGKKLGG